MIFHLHIVGSLFTALALLHVGFPRYFKWREELAPLSLLHRQMMQVHTAFIALTVLLMGLLCLTSAIDLVSTPLGRRICLLLGIFWTLRLFVQLFVYSTELWKGKPFETIVHIVFSSLWTYVSLVFLAVALV